VGVRSSQHSCRCPAGKDFSTAAYAYARNDKDGAFWILRLRCTSLRMTSAPHIITPSKTHKFMNNFLNKQQLLGGIRNIYAKIINNYSKIKNFTKKLLQI
jgi:hypothetical protein